MTGVDHNYDRIVNISDEAKNRQNIALFILLLELCEHIQRFMFETKDLNADEFLLACVGRGPQKGQFEAIVGTFSDFKNKYKQYGPQTAQLPQVGPNSVLESIYL